MPNGITYATNLGAMVVGQLQHGLVQGLDEFRRIVLAMSLKGRLQRRNTDMSTNACAQTNVNANANALCIEREGCTHLFLIGQ